MSGDGCLEWLGRKDMTKKVRGHSVDLTAVKSAVETLRGVREAAVVTREDRPGDVRLVAYFVPSGPDAPAFAEMRRSMREKLSDYMIPTAWVLIDAIPLTENGKVDLNALPAPGMKRLEAKSGSEPPLTPIETEIAGIWAQVLSVQQVGRNDDFFELGGHSLSAAQVISRVSARFQVYISHEFLFRSATVAGMALTVAVQLVRKAQADGSDDLITRLLEDGLADSSPPVRQ
jgi:acyl carrier protein